jgi:hypothetical protein
VLTRATALFTALLTERAERRTLCKPRLSFRLFRRAVHAICNRRVQAAAVRRLLLEFSNGERV